MIDSTTILAIPPAIHALRELFSDFIKTGAKRPSFSADLERAKTQLDNVFLGLQTIANTSRELEAWKRIHHITNRLDTDLVETFPSVATRSRTEFVALCDDKFRRTVDSELRSADRQAASLPELRLLMGKKELLDALKMPDASLRTDGELWYNCLLSWWKEALGAVEDGNFGTVYDKLTKLRQLSTDLNSLADDRIKGIIEEQFGLMERFRDELHRGRIAEVN